MKRLLAWLLLLPAPAFAEPPSLALLIAIANAQQPQPAAAQHDAPKEVRAAPVVYLKESYKKCYGDHCEMKTVWVRPGGYPIRMVQPWYSGCDSWKHMLTGEHRGKYDPAWLSSLNWTELQSLHSDAHSREGTHTPYVRRPR